MTRLAPWTLVLATAGCGPSLEPTSDGGGSTADAAETTDGDETGDETGLPPLPPPPSCVSEPVEGSDPFPDPTDCDAYVGEGNDTPTALTVRIVNGTSTMQTVLAHVRAGGLRHFELAGTKGGHVIVDPPSACPLDWDPPACPIDEGPSCPAIDIVPVSLTLAPGGWDERTSLLALRFETTLPASCTGERDMQCLASHWVGPGSYEIRVAYGPADACTPDETGSCTSEVEPAIEDTKVVAVPWDGVCDEVEVVLQ